MSTFSRFLSYAVRTHLRKNTPLHNHKLIRLSSSLNQSIPWEDRDSSSNINSQYDEISHIPVMLKEVMTYLDPQPGQALIDMTCGGCGHTRKILETVPDVKIYGLDRDPVAYERGVSLQFEYPDRFFPMLGKFSELPSLVQSQQIPIVDGILFDLGCSSMQFEDSRRGFGLSQDGPLDMRMDGNRFPEQPTAADVIEHIEEEHLAKILKYYGDEKRAKKIARASLSQLVDHLAKTTGMLRRGISH